jgi:hypothetical protein
MPKWIMRLVPDVPLGAEFWVTAAGRLTSETQFYRIALPARLFKLPSSLESEAPW